MKITTVREIVQKDGSKTVITISEEEMNGTDETQLRRYLDTIGYYDSQTLLQKFWKFIGGK